MTKGKEIGVTLKREQHCKACLEMIPIGTMERGGPLAKCLRDGQSTPNISPVLELVTRFSLVGFNDAFNTKRL